MPNKNARPTFQLQFYSYTNPRLWFFMRTLSPQHSTIFCKARAPIAVIIHIKGRVSKFYFE